MKTLATVIFSMTLAGAAFAQDTGTSDPTQQSGTQFQQLDTDGNGTINSDEAVAAGLTSDDFSRYDQDGDGELTQEEVRAAGSQGQGTESESMDSYSPSGSDTDTGTTPAQ